MSPYGIALSMACPYCLQLVTNNNKISVLVLKMKRLFVLAIFLLSPQLQALVIDDVDIREIIPATANAPELYLKGASMRRAYAIVDTYIGELYVEDTSLNTQQLIEADKTRRMVFHVVSSRVSARRFTSAINDGLSINLTNEQMTLIKDRVDKLVGLFDYKFVEGTIGYIQWSPAEQVSRIVIDGIEKGTVKGKDLNDAMLKIWIGDHPVSERFKRQVMGEKEESDEDEDEEEDEDDF